MLHICLSFDMYRFGETLFNSILVGGGALPHHIEKYSEYVVYIAYTAYIEKLKFGADRIPAINFSV